MRKIDSSVDRWVFELLKIQLTVWLFLLLPLLFYSPSPFLFVITRIIFLQFVNQKTSFWTCSCWKTASCLELITACLNVRNRVESRCDKTHMFTPPNKSSEMTLLPHMYVCVRMSADAGFEGFLRNNLQLSGVYTWHLGFAWVSAVLMLAFGKQESIFESWPRWEC